MNIKIRRVAIQHIGPFADAILDLEDDVTILTGANDVGKSTLLTLLALIARPTATVHETLARFERVSEADRTWSHDTGITCEIDYVIDDESLPLRSDLRVRRRMVPGTHATTVLAWHDSDGNTLDHQLFGEGLVEIPVLNLNQIALIRAEFPLSQVTNVEQSLLILAFGTNFVEKINGFASTQWASQAKKAAQTVTRYLNTVLPSTHHFTIDIERIPQHGTNQWLIQIILADTGAFYKSIELRGGGVQRVLSIVFALVSLPQYMPRPLLLYDEPETSLHADLQRYLRDLLHDIARQYDLQIVYSTHAPAMLHPMRPRQVRLIRQAMYQGDMQSTIRRIANTLDDVALDLGVNPTDSLILAPITILVEGRTEFLCLPLIFEKLSRHDTAIAAIVDRCLHRIGIVPTARQFAAFCHIVNTQRCIPIIFCDGDKDNALTGTRFTDYHSDVTVITLAEGRELEDLVPRTVYMAALREVLDDATCTSEALDAWITSTNAPQRAFTKQIEGWLKATARKTHYRKWEVMERAVQLCPIEQLEAQHFRDLLTAIDQHALGVPDARPESASRNATRGDTA